MNPRFTEFLESFRRYPLVCILELFIPYGHCIPWARQVSAMLLQLLKHLKRTAMGTALKLTAVGNSVGVILPKELLAKLRVDKGDSLYVVETASGVELSPYEPEFAAQFEAAENIMRENRDVLKKLAK